MTGLYVIIKPMAPAGAAMLILGWCSLLYGVTELINSLKFHSDRKKARQAQEIPVAEEVVDEPTTEAITAEVIEEDSAPTENLPSKED